MNHLAKENLSLKMKQKSKLLSVRVVSFYLAAVAGLFFADGINATVITLDFDTAATGLNIVDSPLSTSAGLITARCVRICTRGKKVERECICNPTVLAPMPE